MTKIIIVGYGSIGKRHLENFLRFKDTELIVYTKRNDLESLKMNQIEIWKITANIRDYVSELIEAKNNAAESHYQMGLNQMGSSLKKIKLSC